jgi:hypothetical protein
MQAPTAPCRQLNAKPVKEPDRYRGNHVRDTSTRERHAFTTLWRRPEHQSSSPSKAIPGRLVRIPANRTSCVLFFTSRVTAAAPTRRPENRRPWRPLNLRFVADSHHPDRALCTDARGVVMCSINRDAEVSSGCGDTSRNAVCMNADGATGAAGGVGAGLHTTTSLPDAPPQTACRLSTPFSR